MRKFIRTITSTVSLPLHPTSHQHKKEGRRTWALLGGWCSAPWSFQTVATCVKTPRADRTTWGQLTPPGWFSWYFRFRFAPPFRKIPGNSLVAFSSLGRNTARVTLSSHFISKHSFPLWGSDTNPTCLAFSQGKKKKSQTISNAMKHFPQSNNDFVTPGLRWSGGQAEVNTSPSWYLRVVAPYSELTSNH